MKWILFIGIIVIFYLSFGHFAEQKNIIPADAIRIRVLANSDSREDQQKKQEVKQALEDYLYDVLASATTVEEANEIIENNMVEIKKKINNSFSGEYTINYGMNYFPKKEYKGILYEEGYYNSLVVSLGKGLGQNWWCILFPPLCMLDGTEMGDVEYRSLVGDILNKYF